MLRKVFAYTLLWWSRKRIKNWENERSYRKHLSQIDYCDGRIDSYKDIERILENIINEHL